MTGRNDPMILEELSNNIMAASFQPAGPVDCPGDTFDAES